MHRDSRFLSSAALRLEDALAQLEASVVARNALEKRMMASHHKINAVLRNLARSRSRGDLVRLDKLHAAHERLQRQMDKAQAACTRARGEFETCQTELNRRAMARAGAVAALEHELDDLRRCTDGMNAALLAALDRAMGIDPTDSVAMGYDSRAGEYGYIPFHVPFFVQLLVDLNRLLHDDPAYADGPHRYRPVSFLEVGCGTGRNLALARDAGLVRWAGMRGFDINPALIALGQERFGLGDALFVGDAMTERLDGADVIFTYRPFSELDMQHDYEQRLAQEMRPGAYLLSPYPQDIARFPELVAMPGARNIWRKRGDG